jgi:hypothetical protein
MMQVRGHLHTRHRGEADSRVFHLTRHQFRQDDANFMSQPVRPASGNTHEILKSRNK